MWRVFTDHITNELLAFGCCNPKILQFFQDKSKYQLLNVIQSVPHNIGRLYWFRWIQLCYFVPFSKKVTSTIGILTSLGKITVSRNCNIQIGWSNGIQKPRLYLWHWLMFNIVLTFYLHQTRALFLCTIFSWIPCSLYHLQHIDHFSTVVLR